MCVVLVPSVVVPPPLAELLAVRRLPKKVRRPALSNSHSWPALAIPFSRRATVRAPNMSTPVKAKATG
jgi:hypothetical protein